MIKEYGTLIPATDLAMFKISIAPSQRLFSLLLSSIERLYFKIISYKSVVGTDKIPISLNVVKAFLICFKPQYIYTEL